MSATARETFIAAMQAILEYKVRGTDIPLCQEEVRQAVEAFVDAECTHDGCGGYGEHIGEDRSSERPARHASLRKECGL